MKVPKRTHNKTRREKGSYTRREAPGIPRNFLAPAELPDEPPIYLNNTRTRSNGQPSPKHCRVLAGAHDNYTQHGVRRGRERGLFMDVGRRSRTIPHVRQAVQPDRISLKHLPQINLPNALEARKSRLFQSSRVETSTSPQHDG